MTQPHPKTQAPPHARPEQAQPSGLPALAYVEALLERMERDPQPEDGGLGLAQTLALLQHLVASPPEGTSGDALVMDLLRVMRHHLRREPCTVLSAPDQLTTTQAAALLGVSRPTLIRYIERGRLHATTVGSHRRLLVADVLRLRASLEQTAQGMERLAALRDEHGDLDY